MSFRTARIGIAFLAAQHAAQQPPHDRVGILLGERQQIALAPGSQNQARGFDQADASPQYICCPPLIESVEPVMNSASSAVRKATPRAMSTAWASRPTGIRATIFSST